MADCQEQQNNTQHSWTISEGQAFQRQKEGHTRWHS